MKNTAQNTKMMWARFASAWVRDGRLSKLDNDDQHALSALKLYLALVCCGMGSESDGDPKVFVSCSPTYDQLQRATGLDRSEILPGIAALERLGLLSVERCRGRGNVYHLRGGLKSGWSKVPMMLVESGKIRDFHMKSTAVSLHQRKKLLVVSMKLYFVFLALRDNHLNRTKASYDKLCELAGVPRAKIRRALSFLASVELIQVENTYINEPDGIGYRPGPNSYFVVGLAPFRPQKSLTVSDDDGLGRTG